MHYKINEGILLNLTNVTANYLIPKKTKGAPWDKIIVKTIKPTISEEDKIKILNNVYSQKTSSARIDMAKRATTLIEQSMNDRIVRLILSETIARKIASVLNIPTTKAKYKLLKSNTKKWPSIPVIYEQVYISRWNDDYKTLHELNKSILDEDMLKGHRRTVANMLLIDYLTINNINRNLITYINTAYPTICGIVGNFETSLLMQPKNILLSAYEEDIQPFEGLIELAKELEIKIPDLKIRFKPVLKDLKYYKDIKIDHNIKDNLLHDLTILESIVNKRINTLRECIGE